MMVIVQLLPGTGQCHNSEEHMKIIKITVC